MAQNILKNMIPDITEEMFEWFAFRTNMHIALVNKYADRLNKADNRFSLDCSDHDRSKFSSPELTPYVYLTWSYKCKSDGVDFKMSDYLKTFTTEATEHHVLNNTHHPECFSQQPLNMINKNDRDKPSGVIIDATKMPFASLGEMVCDWCAVSEERKTKPKDWADSNIGTRWAFYDQQKKLIYEIISKIWGF